MDKARQHRRGALAVAPLDGANFGFVLSVGFFNISRTRVAVVGYNQDTQRREARILVDFSDRRDAPAGAPLDGVSFHRVRSVGFL